MVSLAGAGSSALSIGIMIIIGLMTVSIVGGGLYLYFKWKRYKEFNCVVWERDGFGQLTQTSDKAGIFVDSKTKNKRFFLKKFNVGLSPDNVPYLPSSNGQPKTVYLLRTGLKNFQFITPRVTAEGITLSVGEEDVNWAINSYERAKKMFNSDKLLQYMPYIAIAFVSIIILVIFIYFFKDFAVLKDMAIAMKEAAQAMHPVAASGTATSGAVI